MKTKAILTLFTIMLSVFGVKSQNHSYSKQVEKEYKLGIKAYELKSDEEALEHFNKCLSLDTSCFEANMGIAQIRYQQGDYKKAVLACQNALNNRPNSGQAMGLMGKTIVETGDYKNAAEYLQKSIALGNNSDENQLALARAYSRLNQFDEAAIYFDALSNRQKNNIEYWYYLGNLNEFKGDFIAARKNYEQAITLDSLHHYSNLRLINTLVTLKDFEKIPNLLANAGENSQTPDEQINLLLIEGYYHQEKKEFEKAKTAYEKAYNLDRDNISCLIYFSALYIDMEEYEKAVEKCNQVIDLSPENSEAYFNRGIANEMLRNLEQACADWEEAFLLGSQRAVEYLNSSICNE
ncbi:tetratricopeptide repeat protein [Crocinitomix algicola]|uniref:tetratricopeptide repeat protein n=1 Tax=Crocinitomix algicola TaxID=1740263 RepID=UPI000832D186|nr:tetratricopeptide repeat protein [Crocinitomix algicola]